MPKRPERPDLVTFLRSLDGRLRQVERHKHPGGGDIDIEALIRRAVQSAIVEASQRYRWSTPDHPSLDIVADFDIRAAVAFDRWQPGPAGTTGQAIVTKWDSVSQQSYGFQMLNNGTGILNVFWDINGTGPSNSRSATATPAVTDGQLLAIRITYRKNTLQVKFFIKATTMETALTDCEANTGWTQLGATVNDVINEAPFSGTAPLTVGSLSTSPAEANVLPGRVMAVVVKDGIDGTTVANPYFVGKGIGTFTDGTGKVWSALVNDDPVGLEPV